MSDPAPASGDPEAAADRPLPADLRLAAPVAARGGLLVAVRRHRARTAPAPVGEPARGRTRGLDPGADGLALHGGIQRRLDQDRRARWNGGRARTARHGDVPAGVVDGDVRAGLAAAARRCRRRAQGQRLARSSRARRRVGGAELRRGPGDPRAGRGAPAAAPAEGSCPMSRPSRAVPWEAFVLPFVLAAGRGDGGRTPGRWRDPSPRLGGVRRGMAAFVWALGLALVGLLAFAAIRPSGLEGYVDELRSLGPRGAAVVVGHQILLAPNQAVLTLGAGHGRLRRADRADVAPRTSLCLDRQPTRGEPVGHDLGRPGRSGRSDTAAARGGEAVRRWCRWSRWRSEPRRGSAARVPTLDARASRGVRRGGVRRSRRDRRLGQHADDHHHRGRGMRPRWRSARNRSLQAAYAAAWGIVVGGIAGWTLVRRRRARAQPSLTSLKFVSIWV